jgi:HAD superfamily hydrolase (TIGR01509 family)
MATESPDPDLAVLPAVIFDLDGVLVITEALKAQAHEEAVESLGGSVERRFYGSVMGGSHESVRAAFINEGGLDVAPEEYSQRYGQIYERLLDTGLAVSPGVGDLLEALKQRGYGLAVATSSQQWMVDRIFAKTDISTFFDVVITANDVARHKPAPDAYLAALERIGVSPESAVVFEDSGVGVSAAIAAGIRVIGLRHEYNTEHDFRSVARTIESFHDTGQVVGFVDEMLADTRRSSKP